jgi:pimeloyl-ACP methyl ester carboxylesterase
VALLPGRAAAERDGQGPAILAELAGEWWLPADAAALATIERPALLVAAAGSRPEFRKATDALADALPNAQIAPVAGGHLIDPAHPPVLAFIEEVLEPTPGALPGRARDDAGTV